jgi:hypothetical protein
MDDLRLWRLLRQESPPAADLVPLLRQLAALPPAERLPFFGALPRALTHADAEVRAAGVLVLGGATGHLAFRQVVGLLHDTEPAVRLAALEALRQSCHLEPLRWVHALFHPEAELRRAALAADRPFPLPLWYALYLLPDPACADLALAKLHAEPQPARLLPLLFDHLDRGLLSRAAARRLIAGIPWPACFGQLSLGPVRAPADYNFLLLAALKAGTPEAVPLGCGEDALDRLFALFWEEDAEDREAGERPPAELLFDAVQTHLLGQPLEAQYRVVAALVLTAARRGSWPPGAADVCITFYPAFLRFAWVPAEVRGAAVQALYDLGERCPRRTDDEVRQLVESPLARRPSGDLDLWVIGGLLHLLQKEPYKLLRTWIPLERIVRSFLADVEHAIPFLGLKDNSEWGTRDLLDHIARAARPSRTFLLGLLTCVSPAEQLDFLEGVTPGEAITVFLEIRRLGLYRGLSLSPSKRQRAAEILGDRIAASMLPSGGALEGFLKTWLALPAPEETELGLLILARAARAVAAAKIVLIALSLDLPLLKVFLRAVVWSAGFPYEKEVELARALAGHRDPEVCTWAEDRLPAGGTPRPAAPPPRKKITRLTRAAVKAVGSADEVNLSRELIPCLAEPVQGLCAPLAGRPTPPAPRVDVCTALLACHDPLAEVVEQLYRFGAADAGFLDRLDKMVVKTWRGERDLPLLGHAWLYRWEEHCYAFGQRLGELPAGLPDLLATVSALADAAVAGRVWDAAARLVALWRWHDKPQFAQVCCETVTAFLVEELTQPYGEQAARMLVTFHESGAAPALLELVRKSVLARLPDLAEPVRAALRWWVSASGLPAPPAPFRPAAAKPEDLSTRIRSSTDPDQLAAWCANPALHAAEETALRLVELGEPGVERLAGLLRRSPPPALRTVAATVAFWPDGPARRGLVTLVRDESADGEARFLVGLELLALGEPGLFPVVLGAACRDGAWFVPEDWQRLLRLGVPARELALRLAASPQPHAYGAAVRHLTEAASADDEEVRQALMTFLGAGSDRWHDLRVQAARALHRAGDFTGFPLLLRAAVAGSELDPPLLARAPADLVDEALTAGLTGGPSLVNEPTLLPLVDAAPLAVRDDAYGRLMAEGSADKVRTDAASRVGPGLSRARKLRRVAQAFAWGVRAGRELTGRLFSVQMIAGQGLGYTRFEEDRLYITPLPILRGERHARHVVEGLLLHELGHHVYHRGPDKQAVWTLAEKQGLHPLLNLVADEHLERNLRARDEGYGDRLKKLAAYAFQHSVREVAVELLLNCLQGRAFPVLAAARLGVARQPGCVAVEGGRVLLEMERAGLSFARFVRALRMGLGNRHGDPKVAQGLALFRRGFRASKMEELLEIARRLREIFGWETGILSAFAQDELLRAGQGDLAAHGEGISQDEVQSEVQRVLNPPKERGQKGAGGPPGPRWINVNPNEQFNLITQVVPVPFDPAKHADYAQRVARHARRMRRYLERLGLAMRQERYRVRGRSVDRTRTRALVLHGDPRLLIARHLRIQTDLFLGVLVDCSGSMQSGNNIEKARLFGTLLAEAARGFRGIDLRLFGFTDKVIYDAGDARRCAVHSLRADGGNNDAAALWYVANVARASRRRAKLLVMVSDGLPTECSAAALKGLVVRLGQRWKMCCAQVAVQPLAEICFPNYILLDETDLDASVRRFGLVVARLVQKAMKG